MKREILRAEAVSVKSAGRIVLEDIWLSALAGEITGVFGVHGEERETLLRLLSGQMAADSGRFFLNERFAGGNGQASPINMKRTALIGRGTRLVDAFTVAENLLLMNRKIHWFRLMNRQELANQAGQLLRECGLQISADREVGSLEPPDRMMLEIFSALSHGVQLLILDDSIKKMLRVRPDYSRVLRETLQKTGAAMILVSNTAELAASLCDRVAVVQKGITVKILERNDLLSVEELERHAAAEQPLHESRIPQEPVGREVLRCENLQVAVRGKLSPPLSVRVHVGEIVGISSMDDDWNLALVNALSGRVSDWKGSILREGREVSSKFLYRQASTGNPMCVLYDITSPVMIPNLSLEENFLFPAMRKVSGVLGYLGKSAKRFSNRQLEIHKIAEERFVNSPEERVRFSMERIKLLRPELMVLLEQGELLNLELGRLVKDELSALSKKTGILMVSSDLEELMDVCDYLVVVRQGALSFSGRMDEFRIRQKGSLSQPRS